MIRIASGGLVMLISLIAFGPGSQIFGGGNSGVSGGFPLPPCTDNPNSLTATPCGGHPMCNGVASIDYHPAAWGYETMIAVPSPMVACGGVLAPNGLPCTGPMGEVQDQFCLINW